MILHMLAAGVGFIITIAVLTALVVLLVKAIKTHRGGGAHPMWAPQAAAAPAAPAAEDPTDSALRLLSDRLAKGEIEVDDYYARRAALKGFDPKRPEPGVGI